MSGEKSSSLCPSASGSMRDSVIVGVVRHTDSSVKVAYLEKPVEFESSEWAKAISVDTGQVFRLAGRCAKSRCLHFSAQSEQCTLVDRIVTYLNPVVEALPPCAVRKRCVWWQQHGKEACNRCPQVVTHTLAPSDADLAAVGLA